VRQAKGKSALPIAVAAKGEGKGKGGAQESGKVWVGKKILRGRKRSPYIGRRATTTTGEDREIVPRGKEI